MNRPSFLSAVLAFIAGYQATDWVFRAKQIPYPFEVFGAAVGLGLACWTYGLWSIITRRSHNPGTRT